MTRAFQSLAAALVCGAALLTGCGGDGALSQAEFKKQGNAICQKFLDESKKLEEPQDISQIGAYAEKAAPLFDDLIEDLKGLEPPEKVAADFDKLVETAEKARGRLGDVEKAAKAKDQPRLQELATAAETEDKRSDELARKVGLDTCAQ